VSQQINLYDARFRKQKKPFCATTVLATLAAVLVVSLALAAVCVQRNRTLEAALGEAEKRAQALRDQAVGLARDSGEQGRSSALGDELARVEEQLRLRRELLASMSSEAGGSLEGFSPYLTALARRTMNGVWLTSIEVAGTSGEVALKGRVLDSELVPAYIRGLNGEPLFSGRTVSELRLAAKSEASKRYVEFSLQIPPRKGAS
jgi:hypothetical protein